jgi:hypothetical protein
MTSPEAFGPQFKDHILLHRGIRHVHPGVVSSGGMGVHWSHDKDVAHRFADYWDDYSEGHSEDNQGVVISGLVHKDDIIEPHSDEWHDAQQWGSAINNEIYEPEHSEQEATVRPGAKVHVVALEHSRDVPNKEVSEVRRMSYKNPRVGKA